MKKWFLVLILVVLVIITALLYKYNIAVREEQDVRQLNMEYENFTKGEITGTSLITLINKTVDINRKNNIAVDKDGLFVENDTNSIKVDVKFLESDTVFEMEKIEKLRFK